MIGDIAKLKRAAEVGGAVEKLRLLVETQRQGVPPVDLDERRIPLPAGFDERNSIVISASQVENFMLCGRKWLGEKVFDLPVPERGFLLFGTALHGVCERYLKADDLGRLPDGRPVELYPQGWDEGLSGIDSDLIQKLVRSAIEGAVLVRHPRRRIEHGFLRHLVEVDGITVFVTGWIDYLRPFVAIEDHKTTKDIGRWAKNAKPDSDNYLGKSRQMLIYARELLVLAEEAGELVPSEVLLRHNYFCKNPEKPAIKPVEVVVPVARVLEHWEELKLIAADMVRARARNTDLNRWHDFPLPRTQARACEAFGGCQFRTICGGRETPFRYMTRHQESVNVNQQSFNGSVGAAVAPINGPMPTSAPGVNVVSVRRMPAPPAPPAAPRMFNLINPQNEQIVQVDENSLVQAMAQFGPDLHVLLVGEASQEWKKPASYGVGVPQQAPAPPPPPPAPPAAAPMGGVPWAVPGCKACGGRGFNSQGNPCRICYGSAAPENHPQNFDITTDGQGNVVCTRKAGATAPVMQPMPAAAPTPQVQQAPVQLNPELAQFQQEQLAKLEGQQPMGQQPMGQQPMAQQQPAQAGQPQPTPGTQPAAPRRGPGRPRKAAPPNTPQPTPGTQQAPTPPAMPAAPGSAPVAQPAMQQMAPPSPHGFRLLINCVPSKTDETTGDLADSLAKWGAMLAQSRQVQSYYHLNAFERRDLLKAEAASIAAELPAVVIARVEKGSDLADLVSALRPFAAEVIEAAA